MAPKGGSSGGGGGGGHGSSSSGGGRGGAIIPGNRASPNPGRVSSGGNLSHDTSQLMMCMVVVPALWYLLDDARMTEVVRWVVGRIVGARAVEGEALEGEEGEVVGCDGKKGGDAAMDEQGYSIGRLEGIEEEGREGLVG